jgi:GNAT superfamily N-acetyltransferase
MTDFGPREVRLMQGLAQEVLALDPSLVNGDASVGELAWLWGKDHAALGDTWRSRLLFDGIRLVAWGWTFLPYEVLRSDGKPARETSARLAWQVHPDHPELLDDLLTWYLAQAPGVDHFVAANDTDKQALARLPAHGFHLDEQAAGPEGSWTQLNHRDLADLPPSSPPPGFRFRTAGDIGPAAAVQAHIDAWHPSSFTEVSYAGVREMWPYREDLHVLLQAPDGTLAATAIIWLDPATGIAEFEPVGTHRAHRRQGLASALLLHGLHVARDAGATQMLVASLGADSRSAARDLYYGLGFRKISQDVPFIRRVDEK